MKDITITIIAIVVAGAVIFLVPLMTFLDRVDNVTQEKVQLIVDEFVAEITNTGKMTRAMYQNLVNELESTGNTYDIEMEFHILDENAGVKTSQANYLKIGENLYLVYTDTQKLPEIGIKVDGNTTVNTTNDTVLFNKGDKIYIWIQSENSTDSQTYKSSILGFSNANEYAISADGHGMVKVNGVK